MKGNRVVYLVLLFLTIVCYGQQKTKYRKYVVRMKATIETVAFLNDVTPEQILLANPTFNPSVKLKPGTVVNIPLEGSGEVAKSTASKSSDKVSYEGKVSDKTSPDGKSPNKVSSGEKGSDKTSSGAKNSDKASSGNKGSDKTSSSVKNSGKTSTGEMASDKALTGMESPDKDYKVPQNTVNVNETHVEVAVPDGGEKVVAGKTAPSPDVVPTTYGNRKINFSITQKTVSIAVLLPFENTSLAQRMAELYSGMVIAASDMSENSDYEFQLKAYSTEDLSNSHLDEILSHSDVIVGPVHNENFQKVALWAKNHQKPIVSPLSAFDVNENDFVICMPPVQSSKSDPLSSYLSSDKNIVLIEHSEYANKQLLDEFKKIAPNARNFKYVRESVTPQALAPLMDPNKENVVLVPTDQQGAIEDILSKITAINSPVKTCNISIIGSSTWMTLSNFSQTLLFKGNVLCPSSYFYDRNDKVVSTLFDDYINAYERIPGRFAMRGYDIVDIIANSLQKWGSDMLVKMDGEEFIPLQTPYCFVRNETNGNIQNVRWMLIAYSEDYSISIK